MTPDMFYYGTVLILFSMLLPYGVCSAMLKYRKRRYFMSYLLWAASSINAFACLVFALRLASEIR